MADDILLKIKEAEEQASLTVSDAKSKAGDIIKDAKDKANFEYKKIISDAKKRSIFID